MSRAIGRIAQKFGPNGERLCTWCEKPVPKGRRSWCGDACIEAYLIRRNPGYARRLVACRDAGICAICRIDTRALQDQLGKRTRFDAARLARIAAKLRRLGWTVRLSSRGIHASHWWEMDHIVPVVEGGGGCGLENLRTLCIPCHHRVSADLAARRAMERRQSKAPLLPFEVSA